MIVYTKHLGFEKAQTLTFYQLDLKSKSKTKQNSLKIICDFVNQMK